MKGINTTDTNIVEIFKKNSILGVENVVFTRHNLIIGENGSGKTRFLKTVARVLCDINKTEATVLTLYFPEIPSVVFSGQRVESQNNEDQETAIFIFDYLRQNIDLGTCDILKTIVQAKDCFDFIREFFKLVKVRATGEQRRARKTLDDYNKQFHSLVNRKFIEVDEQVIVEKYLGNEMVHKCLLEEAFQPSEISPGELMLFYFSLFFNFIEIASDKEFIVIIDEPEQHLHPQKQILLLNMLRESSKVSELWIASHSVFLIPFFDFESIVLLENGNVINRNSDLYHKAVLDLVGQENKIVLDFIGTLDAWQYYQFIVECFTLPEAKLANSRKDEQLMACIEVIRTRSTTRPYTILDYGAGKFRLWDCIKKEIPNKDKRTTILKYVAYEPYPDNSSIVDQDMILVTDNNELGKFARVFDLVFLLNVLHEIPVQNWLLTFQQIGYLLKDNGVLVIIEPTRLTRGEQPYGNNGYLVLGEEQIRQLFRDVLCFKVAGAKRSNCWIVNKKSLETITIEAVYRCINSLYASTGKALKKEFLHKIEMSTSREKADVEISSRHYAFLSQQYINAKFALETMQGN